MAKQQVIPGSDGDRHRDLDGLGPKWDEIKHARMDLTAQESKLKEKALALLKKHGIEKYTVYGDDENYEIFIEHGEETAKIKRAAKVIPDKEEAAIK
jgi:L-rhamnose mutarotase